MKRLRIAILLVCLMLIIPFGVNAESEWRGYLNDSANIVSTTFPAAICDDSISTYIQMSQTQTIQVTFLNPINIVSFSMLRSDAYGTFYLRLYDKNNVKVFDKTISSTQVDRYDLSAVGNEIKKVEIYNANTSWLLNIKEFEIYKSNDYAKPYIVSVSPTNNSTNNSIDTTVSVRFNENIKTTTINECTIEGIACNVTASGNTLVIMPNEPLSYLSSYTAIIKGVQDLNDNIMLGENKITFQTEQDTRPIEVINIIPPPGSENIPIDTEVKVQFNKSNLDESTIAGVRLLDNETEIPVDRTLVADTIILKIQQALENSKVYTIDISGIKDVIGNGMETAIAVTFKTELDLSPFAMQSIKPPMSSIVGLNEAIEVEFNKNIFPDSIVYQIKDKAGNIVNSLKSVVGKKLTVTPILKNNEKYTFVLSDAADVYGNHISAPINLTFETMKTTGNTDMDSLLTKILNLFKNSKYFGLIIVIAALAVAFIFILARWLWMKTKRWMANSSPEKKMSLVDRIRSFRKW